MKPGSRLNTFWGKLPWRERWLRVPSIVLSLIAAVLLLTSWTPTAVGVALIWCAALLLAVLTVGEVAWLMWTAITNPSGYRKPPAKKKIVSE